MWTQEALNKANTDTQPLQVPVPTSVSRPIEERRVVAWFGKSVVVKGHLTSSEDIRIEGKIEGTIELPEHTLTIGPGADVRASIVAKTVTIRGTVAGKITASDKVEIGETGIVEGDIISPKLAIADGAVIQGRIDTARSGDKKHGARPLLAAAG
jgi:cytoskeletal protein CcmA (bactofilin family)